MNHILVSLGFKHLETLKEFSLRFPNLSTWPGDDLDKIWICHKTNPLNFDVENLPNECDYENLISYFKKTNNFNDETSECIANSVLNKIYEYFKCPAATYILKECHLFYNWGTYSFEIICGHNEIYQSINGCKSRLCPSNTFSQTLDNTSLEPVAKNAHFIKKGSQKNLSKVISLKTLRNAVQGIKPFLNLPRNPSCLTQEAFTLNSILYDSKIKPQWPGKHILSMNDVDKLLGFIVTLSSSKTNLGRNALKECQNWVLYKKLLQLFFENHNAIGKNNGFGRILKKHLKSVRSIKGQMVPISNSIIYTYVIDILRRVVPFDFYTNNYLKKCFFSSVVKIISGAQKEKYIWYPFLEVFLRNKSKLSWCLEMSDEKIQDLMILNTFKFLIIHYVFVLLRNNFYVTETGSSGYGLRFYNKIEIQRACKAKFNELLYYKHVRFYKKLDFDPFTIERKWIDTGIVDGEDLKRKCTRTMHCDTEFKQPVAVIKFLPKSDCCRTMRIVTNILPRSINCINSSVECTELLEKFEVRYNLRKKKLLHLRLFLECIRDGIGSNIGSNIGSLPQNLLLEVAWRKAIFLKRNYGELYFVKADISNAFDSVIIEKLINILYEKVQIENKKTIQLKKITEWKIKNTKIQKGVRFGFSSRPKENRLLVNRSDRLDGKQKLPEYRVSELIDIVKQIVIHQRIKINGKLLKFVKGLAQGSAGKLSVLLCDIYYGFMDELYFKEINNCEKSILIRVVDDYLLITSVFERAELFFKIVQCGVRDFNARFNLDKLTSNLVDDIREVTYLGLVFNFEDMSVTPDYSKYEKNNFLTMMKLSDNLENMHFDKDYFFGKKILSLSALKLQTIVLNDMYNNVEAIRKIILQASVFQSIRAMTLANYLYPKGRKNELAVSKIVLKFGDRITKIASSQSGISEKEITWLFLTAVVATFKRRSGQFKTLLLIMRYKLQKCEKGFLGHEKTILSYFKKFFNNEVNLILNAFLGSKLTEKAFK